MRQILQATTQAISINRGFLALVWTLFIVLEITALFGLGFGRTMWTIK